MAEAAKSGMVRPVFAGGVLGSAQRRASRIQKQAMEFAHEKQQALRILQGIEEGTMTAAESHTLLEAADPTLVYFIFKWLRKRYRDHPAADGVLGRLRDICNTYRSITRKAKEGESDPIVEWFEGAYKYTDFTGPEFIDITVEKLEG